MLNKELWSYKEKCNLSRFIFKTDFVLETRLPFGGSLLGQYNFKWEPPSQPSSLVVSTYYGAEEGGAVFLIKETRGSTQVQHEIKYKQIKSSVKKT